MKKGKRMVRLGLMALCLAAALCSTGCATSEAIADGKDFGEVMQAMKNDLFGSGLQMCSRLELRLPVREGFTPIEDKTAYASLKDTTMKEAYQKIEESIYQISSERADNGCFLLRYTRLPSELEFDDIYIVKEAVLADHPEAFWVLGSYDIRNNFHDGNYLVLYSKYSYEEITAFYDDINIATERILAQIPDNADELTRETVIHDALVDSVSYDFEAAEADDSSQDAFNIYGTLVKQKAVCTGYACSTKMLLNRVGIECRTVVGMSKNSGHMWNQVKINENWYNLDVTWDDSATESDVLYSRYSYFNLTDERLNRNHKTGKNISEMECEYTEDDVYVTSELYNFDLEVCTSTEANYYSMHALTLDQMNDASVSLITDKMIETAQAKGELLYIIFDESVSAEKAETWLSKNTGGQYSALGRSLSKANQSGKISRVKTCNLVRMSSGEDDVWPNLYAVRLIYA